MPFCANCGASVEGRFCEKCGAPVGSTAAPATDPLTASGLSDNIAAALCYALLVITGIVFLLLEPYNRNRTIRFHAFQAIFLGVAWFAVSYVLGSLVFGIIHLAFLFVLTPLLSLAFFVLWLYMIITAYQGKKVVLPVIGPLAQQQA